MDAMAAIKQTFFQECEEQLSELEPALLRSSAATRIRRRSTPCSGPCIRSRAGAGAFNLTDLVHFAHVFENTMDRVRTGKLEPTPDDPA